MKITQLDPDNSILYFDSCLLKNELPDFLHLISTNQLHQPTLKIFGNSPKFFDTTFSTFSNTVPSKHYHQSLITTELTTFSNLLKSKFDSYLENNFNTHYNCNLVHYSPIHPRGGSRGKHQDNPTVGLNLVLIYSFGQTREFAIYKDNKIVKKLPLHHNSLVALIGPTFQKIYHHSLLPLALNIVPFNRWSFNSRFI
jgi:hypothetical protein